jgi:hypothetical protein
LQFVADELEHGQSPKHIDRRIAFSLGAIQDRQMNRGQHSLQVGGGGFAQLGGTLAGANEFVLNRRRNVHFKQRFHCSETANVARQMEAQIRRNARTQTDIVAEIVDA